MMVQRKRITLKDRIIQGALLIIFSLTIFSHSVLFEELSNSDSLLSQSVLRETWRLMIDMEGLSNRSNCIRGRNDWRFII